MAIKSSPHSTSEKQTCSASKETHTPLYKSPSFQLREFDGPKYWITKKAPV